MAWVGRLFCLIGWHDWYEGTVRRWCQREGCTAAESLMYGDDDD